MNDFSGRIPCSDGNCIGTLNEDGVCSICGKPGPLEVESHRQDHASAYLNLDKHFHRLLEIEEVLGEIGAIFDGESSKMPPQNSPNALRSIADSVNKLRIPGFFAYHLAQEALCLLHIVAALCSIGKQSGGGSSEKVDQVLKHIDDVEPVFRKALYDMEPYKSMNAKEAIEVITARIAEKERQ